MSPSGSAGSSPGGYLHRVAVPLVMVLLACMLGTFLLFVLPTQATIYQRQAVILDNQNAILDNQKAVLEFLRAARPGGGD